MSANLELWNQLEATDPAYTKNFNRSGFKGTAINPCYVAKKLTETFGPCGIGWRFVIEDERYEPGAAIDDLNREIVHVIRGHLEYKPIYGDGQVEFAAEWIATGPQFGQTMFVGLNRHGAFTDEEAPKKSISDCLSKCAVMLGLSADIHLGLWDSNKYVNDPGSAEGDAPKRTPRKETPKPAPSPLPAKLLSDIQGADEPAKLAAVLDKATRTPKLYDDPPVWEEVCNQVANQFRKLNLPDDPASQRILEVLQQERARLDLNNGAGSTANETAEQETEKPVRKTRGRKKSVSS